MNRFDLLKEVILAFIIILAIGLIGFIAFRSKKVEEFNETNIDAEEVWIGEYIQSGMSET